MVKKNIRHNTHHVVDKKDNNVVWILVIVLGVALVASVYTDGFKVWPQSKEDNKDNNKIQNNGEKPVLDLYVMSICPYGVVVENALKPVVDELGDEFVLNIEYILNDLGDGKFSSLHGQPEVDGNKVQLCAREISGRYEYFDMIYCMNQNAGSIPGNWEVCAANSGLDVDAIRICYEGEEGNNLLSESAQKSAVAGATGSPTILLNGERFGKSGATTTTDFLRGICGALEQKPDACLTMPECESDADCVDPQMIGRCENPGTAQAKCVFSEPVKVDFIAINDKLCERCDTSNGIQTSLSLFPGADLLELDYEDPKAQEILSKTKINLLPAYIFGSSLDQTANFAQVSQHFVKEGEYWYIRPASVGSIHDPLAEICDNGVDDRDNDGLIDCDDDECENTIVCREEIENLLEVFVMSQCPYGTQALDSMKEVLESFGNQIDFRINFIATENPDGSFSALHGQPEVAENIRELCAIKYYPEKYMDYIWCRNKNIMSSAWESCAVDGIDSAIIKACSEGQEGKTLLSENIKIANSLGIGASPTWMVNNKFKFSGIDPETIRANFCQYNDLAGCENTLSGSAGAPAGNC